MASKTDTKPAAAVGGCSLKTCTLGPLTRDGERVEVKGFEPPPEKLPKMSAAWSKTGEASFHGQCWRDMLASAKGKEGCPFQLMKEEKDVVLDAAKTAEFFDSIRRIESEAARVAKFLKTANHAIAFTGAGISTAAGIGDFRGKSGKWTENDRAKAHGKAKHARSKGYRHIDLRPTYTHEALVKLVEMGYLKFIISQNTDGLHRLSGIPRDRISELHGNTTHEKCEECGARYERTHAVRMGGASVPPGKCKGCRLNHRTGRMCERKSCKGYLMNTIINFGDNLETPVIGKAEQEAEKNDFVLCLGSTLRVTPACDLVEMGEPVRLAICNRQPTPFDLVCGQHAPGSKEPQGSRVFGDCDVLMRSVMKNILPEEELEEWEGAREDRMRVYDKQRTI